MTDFTSTALLRADSQQVEVAHSLLSLSQTSVVDRSSKLNKQKKENSRPRLVWAEGVNLQTLHPILLARELGANFIVRKGEKQGFSITAITPIQLSNLLKLDELIGQKVKVDTPPRFLETKKVVYGIHAEITEDQLFEELRVVNPNIII